MILLYNKPSTGLVTRQLRAHQIAPAPGSLAPWRTDPAGWGARRLRGRFLSTEVLHASARIPVKVLSRSGEIYQKKGPQEDQTLEDLSRGTGKDLMCQE